MTDVHNRKMPPVGITGTVPVEIIFASGRRPVDLNNHFIASGIPQDLVSRAESAGFSHSICAWIKGIYSTVLDRGFKEIIAVTGGDCSNTIALGEVLSGNGVKVISFEFPHDRDRARLVSEMEKLMRELGTTWNDVESVRRSLAGIRKKLRSMDRITWERNTITGLENHSFLVESSDFGGDPEAFEKRLDLFLEEVRERRRGKGRVRLGYLGVPPIFGNLYNLIENMGARVVFNEVQRQFSMPHTEGDLVDQYLTYTYPYDVKGRIEDINHAVKERSLDGVIHYTQTFCYRQIYDIMIRRDISVPVLTLEGDRPGLVDSRTALRIETFVEMLSGGFS